MRSRQETFFLDRFSCARSDLKYPAQRSFAAFQEW